MIKSNVDLAVALEAAHEECLMELNKALYKESSTLYHYTDLTAGLAILEKSSLRFTDVKYCNDPGEFDDGLKILNKITNEVFNFYFEESPQFIIIMSYIRHILNLSSSFEQDDEKNISDAQAEFAKYGIDAKEFNYKKTSVFVCSLSERSDNLRQWLPYANDAKGVALGFKGIVNNQHSFTGSEKTIIMKVSYASIEDKEQYVINIFDHAYKIYKSMDLSLLPDFVSQVSRGLLFDIIACKSENYKDEQEWRLIRVENSDDILDNLNFNIRDNIIRPFIEVPFIRDTLLEIRLGPKTESNLNSHALNRAIKKFGYQNAKIDKSKISYR